MVTRRKNRRRSRPPKECWLRLWRERRHHDTDCCMESIRSFRPEEPHFTRARISSRRCCHRQGPSLLPQPKASSTEISNWQPARPPRPLSTPPSIPSCISITADVEASQRSHPRVLSFFPRAVTADPTTISDLPIRQLCSRRHSDGNGNGNGAAARPTAQSWFSLPITPTPDLVEKGNGQRATGNRPAPRAESTRLTCITSRALERWSEHAVPVVVAAPRPRPHVPANWADVRISPLGQTRSSSYFEA